MKGDTSISGKKIVEESLAEASGGVGWGGSSGWTNWSWAQSPSDPKPLFGSY